MGADQQALVAIACNAQQLLAHLDHMVNARITIAEQTRSDR